MTISVVIPIYARQASAERAARSALAQDGVDLEVILVDDGSPIPFEMPADVGADGRARLIRQDNGGASSARNRGVREARGDWIAFLDSDDFWLPGKLRKQSEIAHSDAAAGTSPIRVYVTGFRQIALSSGSEIVRIPIESDDPADFASGCWFAPGSTALLPRALFDLVGPFDETLPRLEDLDWYLRLALLGGGIRSVSDVLSVVEVGGKPTSERLRASIETLQRKWQSAGASDGLDRPAWNRLQAYLDLEWASVMRAEQRPLRMAAALLRSVLRHPRRRLHLKEWWISEP